MASPGQRRGKCGHAMALFDTHTHCERCREKGKGQDFCVENPNSADKCPICITFTSDQRLQLATPAYKIKKEKREAKAADSTPSKETEEFVDPASVAVIGAIDSQGTVKTSASAPPPPHQRKSLRRNARKTLRR